MRYDPHEYQKLAIDHIIQNKASALLLDMGLGKSSITLTAINQLYYDYFDINKVLVIAPKKVAEDTWPEELIKWDHLSNLKHSLVLGSADQRIAALKVEADLYIINRENVSWLVDYYKTKWPFDTVIIDELSSFKSSKAKRFKDLRKVRPYVKRIVGLTGTPRPNGLIDLWSQIYLLDMGERLGRTMTAYKDKYFKPGRRNGHIIYEWLPRDGAENEIYKKISDICVSMRSVDHLKMPEKIENFIPVNLSPSDMAKYQQLEKDLLLPFAEGEGDIVAENSASLSNKLLQMANGAVYDENGETKEIHRSKLEALAEILEASNGKPVLVFYWYKHDLSRLKEAFPEARELNSKKDIEEWNNGTIKMLLAHPASAGHGLNLQYGGSTIVWFALTWSLELYQQANARLYRQGQKETVVINHLIAKGTVDESVRRALLSKEKGQDAMIEAVKAKIQEWRGVNDKGRA